MIGLIEKLSVNIKVVGLNVEHNFLIPKDMCVSDAVDLVVKSLCDEYHVVKSNSSIGYSLKNCSHHLIYDFLANTTLNAERAIPHLQMRRALSGG